MKKMLFVCVDEGVCNNRNGTKGLCGQSNITDIMHGKEKRGRGEGGRALKREVTMVNVGWMGWWLGGKLVTK